MTKQNYRENSGKLEHAKPMCKEWLNHNWITGNKRSSTSHRQYILLFKSNSSWAQSRRPLGTAVRSWVGKRDLSTWGQRNAPCMSRKVYQERNWNGKNYLSSAWSEFEQQERILIPVTQRILSFKLHTFIPNGAKTRNKLSPPLRFRASVVWKHPEEALWEYKRIQCN